MISHFLLSSLILIKKKSSSFVLSPTGKVTLSHLSVKEFVELSLSGFFFLVHLQSFSCFLLNFESFHVSLNLLSL